MRTRTTRPMLQAAMIVMLVTTTLTLGCSKPSAAEQLSGSYSCTTTHYTRYQKGNEWRDTMYVYKNDATLMFSAIDDETVSFTTKSKHFGEVTAERLTLRDWETMCNISGDGEYLQSVSSTADEATITGTFVYSSNRLALSVKVPGRGSKYILSFTNS